MRHGRLLSIWVVMPARNKLEASGSADPYRRQRGAPVFLFNACQIGPQLEDLREP